MQLADRGLNRQALAIQEGETKIRMAVKRGYLKGMPQAVINAEVQKIIRDVLKDLATPTLREATYRSLNAFATRQYRTYVSSFGIDPTVLLAMLIIQDQGSARVERERAEEIVRESPTIQFETQERGVPLQEYSRDYLRNRVDPIIERLAAQVPLDPDDAIGRNSLRNRAEMEVRYADHLRQIADLRASGAKLVVSSVHADCSDRCFKWQGRVYSLDGTTGVTEDGRPFEPLEKATDIYYTTNAGKVYKNGLLGFNCRHYLMPYRPGMVIPHVDKETQQREQKINTRQRELELVVRNFRTQALMNKGINRTEYLAARKNAIEANREYVQFSHENGRAYYPSRTETIVGERK